MNPSAAQQVFNGRKLQVLEFLEKKSWTIPSELVKSFCPTLQAAYVYLKKLHRQGLLLRHRDSSPIRYRISSRGLDRLAYLRRTAINGTSPRSERSGDRSLR